jgi:hypothetical protein
MSDSSEDFVNGLKEQYGEPGHDKSHPQAQSWSGLASNLLGSTSATISGMGKGLAQMGAPPGGVSLREADPEGPVASWAKSENKDYPVAEKAGRWAAEYGPLAVMPETGGGEAAMARLFSVPRNAAGQLEKLPRLAQVMSKGLEGTWRGGVGGATQGDTKTGAEVGGGTATGTAAFMAAPSWVKTLAGLAALEGVREGGAKLPWGSWHMAHPLALMAATLLGKFPGLSGALGAKAFGGGGDGDNQERREPF